MAQWLVKHLPDPPRYEVEQDGRYACGVAVPNNPDALTFWRLAKMIKANIARRFEDDAPIFAAPADQPEAIAFAGMLNE